MKVGKNKLKSFIIVMLLFAFGCEGDKYSTNREEFATDVRGDREAPTVSVRAALIKNTENAVVQSTEKGTVYLVRTTVAVSTPASIKGAADNLWNRVNIIFPDTNTNLPATGLADGTYKAYAEDSAGNISSASTNNVTIDSNHYRKKEQNWHNGWVEPRRRSDSSIIFGNIES